jgi:hypothetical protein
MAQTAGFQETFRRLAMIDEGFVEDVAGLGLVTTSALDPKTVALLREAASVAIGSPALCLEWSAGRALAAGAKRSVRGGKGRRRHRDLEPAHPAAHPVPGRTEKAWPGWST